MNYVTCFHFLPKRISLIVVMVTPYFLESTLSVSVDRFISATSDSVKDDLEKSDPFAWRPLAFLSLLFSSAVPRNRWSGFTHSGLSQVWHTERSAGNGPLKARNEALWASVSRVYFEEICPYLFAGLLHTQHPVTGSGTDSARIFSGKDKSVNAWIGSPRMALR